MDTIELQEQIVAPVAWVWQAWTSPVELSRWQADSARSLGGSRLLLSWPKLGAKLEVEVLARDPMRHLQLRAAHYELDVRLEPGLLRLEHHGTGSAEEAAGVTAAWRTSLALLKHYLERHHGRERRVLWFARTARLPSETAHVFFSDPAALASWLGQGAIGPAGSAYHLELLDGGELSGRVLAHTEGRDIALSCENHNDSALVFRTLPQPRGQRHILLMWSRWDAHESAETDETLLRAAFERLGRVLERPASA
ncbi:MAG TPA: SRPBCC domain-containing protein [Polyangiaceae bacterium]|nr:SRPBCC domain-containing protein [Polyangiaceae bacterium]